MFVSPPRVQGYLVSAGSFSYRVTVGLPRCADREGLCRSPFWCLCYTKHSLWKWEDGVAVSRPSRSLTHQRTSLTAQGPQDAPTSLLVDEPPIFCVGPKGSICGGPVTTVPRQESGTCRASSPGEGRAEGPQAQIVAGARARGLRFPLPLRGRLGGRDARAYSLHGNEFLW